MMVALLVGHTRIILHFTFILYILFLLHYRRFFENFLLVSNRYCITCNKAHTPWKEKAPATAPAIYTTRYGYSDAKKNVAMILKSTAKNSTSVELTSTMVEGRSFTLVPHLLHLQNSHHSALCRVASRWQQHVITRYVSPITKYRLIRVIPYKAITQHSAEL